MSSNSSANIRYLWGSPDHHQLPPGMAKLMGTTSSVVASKMNALEKTPEAPQGDRVFIRMPSVSAFLNRINNLEEAYTQSQVSQEAFTTRFHFVYASEKVFARFNHIDPNETHDGELNYSKLSVLPELKPGDTLVVIDINSASNEKIFLNELQDLLRENPLVNLVLHTSSSYKIPQFSEENDAKKRITKVDRKKIEISECVQDHLIDGNPNDLLDRLVMIIKEGESQTGDWYICCKNQDEVTSAKKYLGDISSHLLESEKIIFIIESELRKDCIESEEIQGILMYGAFSLDIAQRAYLGAATSVFEGDVHFFDIKERSVTGRNRDVKYKGEGALDFASPSYNRDETGSSRARIQNKGTTQDLEYMMPDVISRLTQVNREDTDDILLAKARAELPSVHNGISIHTLYDVLWLVANQRIAFFRSSTHLTILLQRYGINSSEKMTDERVVKLCGYLDIESQGIDYFLGIMKAKIQDKSYAEVAGMSVDDFFSIDLSCSHFFAYYLSSLEPTSDVNIRSLNGFTKAHMTQILALLFDIQAVKNTIKEQLEIPTFIDLLLYGHNIHPYSLGKLRRRLAEIPGVSAILASQTELGVRKSNLSREDIPALAVALGYSSTGDINTIKNTLGDKALEEIRRVFKPKLRGDKYLHYLELRSYLSNISRNLSSVPYFTLYLKLFCNDVNPHHNKRGVDPLGFDKFIEDMFPKGNTEDEPDINNRFANINTFIEAMGEGGIVKICDKLESIWGNLQMSNGKNALNDTYKDLEKFIKTSNNLTLIACAAGVMSYKGDNPQMNKGKEESMGALRRMISILNDNFGHY